MTDADPRREGELRISLARLSERIARACDAAGRDPAELTVVAVTKNFPPSDVELLARLGVTDIGENRDQEARAKHEQCAGLGLRWHFVGRLQRNKCRSVAAYADVVHSIDRHEVIDELDRAAARRGRTPTVLIQVSLGESASPSPSPQEAGGRGGAAPADVPALADAVAESGSLELGGLMAIAPFGDDPDSAFARLARVAADLQGRHPRATIISAGMSGDLDSAITHGATHLRIGTALLGHRASRVG